MTLAVSTCELQDALRAILISEANWHELRDVWNSLAGDHPFLSFDWVSTWWQHYRQRGAQLLVLVLRTAEGDVVGIAPWYVQHSLLSGTTIYPLGSGEVCSDYLTILTREDFRERVAQTCARWLLAHQHRWDALELSGVRGEDPAYHCLCDHLQRGGLRLHTAPDQSCWRTQLPDTWDGFLSQLSRSRREKVRSLLRKAHDQGQIAIHEVATSEELDTAFELLIDLHQRRRASLGQEGCFASRSFTEFHRAVAAKMLAAGRLRMRWITWQQAPAAIEYSFLSDDTVYYYQGGIEPQLATHRPGWLCFALTIQKAIEQGYHWYDFLRGDESYKSSWRAEAVPLVKIRVASGHLTARLRDAVRTLVASLRDWARRILKRRSAAEPAVAATANNAAAVSSTNQSREEK